MDEVHFVHTSDWHLGFSQYDKLERYSDFREAAEKIVEKIIELSPQSCWQEYTFVGLVQHYSTFLLTII